MVETFEGQGDFLAEFQAKDVQGAQVDAARATDLGAFADVSFTTMTQPYAEALTAADIIAMSPVYLSEDWYADRAPYAYGAAWPLGTQVGEFAGNAVCEALAGQPAEYADRRPGIDNSDLRPPGSGEPGIRQDGRRGRGRARRHAASRLPAASRSPWTSSPSSPRPPTPSPR